MLKCYKKKKIGYKGNKYKLHGINISLQIKAISIEIIINIEFDFKCYNNL